MSDKYGCHVCPDGEGCDIDRRLAALTEVVRQCAQPLDAVARQVEEFGTWDEQDWPAAKQALDGIAADARVALSAARRLLGEE